MTRGGALLVYNLLLPVALAASLPGFLVKMARRGGYGQGFLQRFGLFGEDIRRRLEGGCAVWIHAVSVGEVFVARKLIDEMRRRDGDARLVLSTTTSTGYAQARELACGNLTVIYNPVDFPWVVAKVLRLVAPGKVVLVEAEIWPNLVTRATRAGIPVMLANARLSPRSEARFLRFASMVRPIFEQLEAVFVPYEDDVERWAALGVRPERIEVVGSVKFDLKAEREERREEVFEAILEEVAGGTLVGPDGRRRQVILLGSTHRGEERLLAQTYLELRREFPGLLLVVVPRHFERSLEVTGELRALGLEAVVRSTCGGKATNGSEGGPAAREEGIRYLLVDTTGELARWYRCADVVVIGKSFEGEGGQNPVEPIVAGVPVFFGPRMSNFAQLAGQLTRHGGAAQVRTIGELRERLAHCLREPETGAKMVERAREVLDLHAGATERTARRILS